MRLLLATLLTLTTLLPSAAAAQDPAAPPVVTGPAEGIGPTTATLRGTVDPNGTATAYRFEYGLTTAYGAATPDAPAGDGDVAVPVQAALEGLAPATTYHYRLVAGSQVGADRSFRTTDEPAVPSVSRLSVTEKTPTSARLGARINPNRAATSFHVEWGTSTQFGSRTPEQGLPAGRRGVVVSVALDDLPPYRRIHWRVVATNAVGTKRSGTASFTTLRALTGMTLAVFPPLTPWGVPVSVTGRVEGAGVNGIPVALEASTFPFSGGFQEVAATRTNRVGRFGFPARLLSLATRFRAVTRNAQVVASPEITATVRPRVSIRGIRPTRRSVRLAGEVGPGLAPAPVRLQRRTRRGVWATVATTALRPLDADRSRYGFRVRRLRRPAAHRVVLPPVTAGAHMTGASRSITVGKREPKPKPKRRARARR